MQKSSAALAVDRRYVIAAAALALPAVALSLLAGPYDTFPLHTATLARVQPPGPRHAPVADPLTVYNRSLPRPAPLSAPRSSPLPAPPARAPRTGGGAEPDRRQSRRSGHPGYSQLLLTTMSAFVKSGDICDLRHVLSGSVASTQGSP